jgi:hypothetical protein
MTEDSTGKIFTEYGISGASLLAISGQDDEVEQKLQGNQGIQTWDTMRRTDHNAAAIVAGLTLPIRRASWVVQTASSKPVDEQAGEFLEQCLEDMSHSWGSMLIDALTFFPFGWAYLEQVMKIRQGPNPPNDAGKSKYDDHRIGWRKISLRPQTSLDHWEVDEHGGVQAMYQAVPRRKDPVAIPIQRALLFRTTTEGNRPEGLSIFRPAWRPWMQRKRLEQVEHMAFCRNLAGILKVRLGASATTEAEAGQESDEAKAKSLIRDAYDDRLVGIIETDQVLASVLEGPKGTDFETLNKAITRKDHEMARSALAHFIILALQERGSYALAKDESDLFLMAVMSYLDMIADVIQRFAVERLFRLNIFPGLQAIPTLHYTAIYKPDIGTVAQAINDLVQANLLTVDDGLEEYIRELAGWPELPADLSRAEREEEKPPPEKPKSSGNEEEEEVDETLEDEEAYADQPRKSKKARGYLDATREYEEALRGIYKDWSRDVARGLKGLGPETTEEELRTKLDDYLGVGLLLLKQKGYEDLLAAYVLGLGSPSVGPDGLRLVQEAQQSNDSYLAGSLFKDIRAKLDGEIAAILLLLKYGREDEAAFLLETTLGSLNYRLPLYGGTYWEMIQWGIGDRITEGGSTTGPPVRRVLDPLAEHCTTCPPKAHEYADWDTMVGDVGLPGDGSDECDGRCRCQIQILVNGVWIWA